jgi:excisionase family DNA binding protein
VFLHKYSTQRYSISIAQVEDEYLTVAEVATMLKLNQQTVRNIIDRGELPAVRVGARRVRILRSDLNGFLAEGRRLTKKSKKRIVFDDAVGSVARTLRGMDEAASAAALIALAEAARDLADELGKAGGPRSTSRG